MYVKSFTRSIYWRSYLYEWVGLEQKIIKVISIMKKIVIALLSMVLIHQVHAAEVKVASVSYATQDLEYNLPKMSELAIDAAKNGAKLIVFPEMAATGLAYLTLQQAGPNIDTIPGKSTSTFGKIAQQYNTYIAFGLIERDKSTGVVYNSAAIVGPNGFIGKYRKNQLAVDFDNYWRAPGNLGFPVFDTPIGKIAILICFDDTQLQSVLLPALRGADIIAYPTGSYYTPRSEDGSDANHSTIGSMATMPGWVGVNVVGSDAEQKINAGPGVDVVGPGGSSIWDSNGKMLASASVMSWSDPKQPKTIYATINTKQANSQRDFWLKNRRPELYYDYNMYRPDHDPNADLAPQQISALLVQYEPKSGDLDYNYKAVDKQISQQPTSFNMVVLPFNSFIGNGTVTKDNVTNLAEPLNGKSYQMASGLAKKYNTYLLFSMPESFNGKYYETAILFDAFGKQIGVYRKSHLNDVEKTWASAGNELPIFTTSIGRVAVVLNDEVRIPEITDIHGINRANMILIPAAYNQKEYGGDVYIPKGLVPEASNKGMYIWYNMAKYSQAFTLVANYVKGEHGDVGQSALYSLVPEEGFYPPSIAPKDKETAFMVTFATNQNIKLWTTQQIKVVERRWEQALPLTLDQNSACFKEWKNNSTSPIVCKDQF